VETVHTVAARGAVAVAVERAAEAVLDQVTADRQRVAPVGQRAADDVGPGEREYGHRAAAHRGGGDG
jgi:hypothetical protein